MMAAFLLGSAACGAPEVGDDCKNALDCSIAGTRLCDLTQRHGYCTVQGCEKGTCPEEAVCVKFRPTVDRLSTTFCMYKCEEDSDCRDDEDYRCLSTTKFGDSEEAEIVGSGNQKFCALPPPPPAPPPTPADAGTL